MDQRVAKEYLRLRALGLDASGAYRGAKTNVAFEEATVIGKVRLRVEVDADPSTAYWTKEDFELADKEGTWGIITEFRCPLCGNWEHAYSCYGFIGDSWVDSMYDVDARRDAIDKLLEFEHRIIRELSTELARRENALVPDDSLIYGLKVAIQIAKRCSTEKLLDTPSE